MSRWRSHTATTGNHWSERCRETGIPLRPRSPCKTVEVYAGWGYWGRRRQSMPRRWRPQRPLLRISVWDNAVWCVWWRRMPPSRLRSSRYLICLGPDGSALPFHRGGHEDPRCALRAMQTTATIPSPHPVSASARYWDWWRTAALIPVSLIDFGSPRHRWEARP